MIAEINGVPIWFCQYYDCWHSREYEIWDMDIKRRAKNDLSFGNVDSDDLLDSSALNKALVYVFASAFRG